MRPVACGDWPRDENGDEIKFKHYRNARRELIKRLGAFCSYCEMRLDASLAVEHVRPKKPEGASENIRERELDWNNFLLACVNCNSTKGTIDVVLDDYFWPDKDNTFLALAYSEGSVVLPAQTLSDKQKEIAENTIKLTGLNKDKSKESSAPDRRLASRREVWETAEESKGDLKNNNTQEMRRQVLRTALGHGYWSVWMTVFKDDADMLKRFIGAFPGTCRESFDESDNYKPIHREGGQV